MPIRGLNRPEGVERQPEDFYATDPATIPPLLKVLGPDWEAGNKLIWEPACVDSETEFYNGYRWKKISEYSKNDKVLCYDNGKAFLEYPLQYIKNKTDEKLYHYCNHHSLDMCLTENHRVYYIHRRNNKLQWKYMKDVVDSYNKDSNGFRGKIPTTFEINGDIELNEWYLRLAIACNADGRTRTIIKKTYEIRVKKQRKKDRILYLLQQAKIPFKILKPTEGYLNVTFQSPYGCKNFPKEWLFLSKKCKKIILDELKYWDGSIDEDNNVCYSTSKKEDADFIQLLAHSIGIHCNINEDKRRIVTNYRLTFGNRTKFALVKNRKNKNIEYLTLEKSKDGFIYCFKVSTGAIILRRNKNIFVTGNCGAGHLSQILELYGHQVISTDLVDRAYGVGGIDFLQPTPYDNLSYDAIITNPPFSLALEFVEKSLRIAPVVCMFLRIGFIESEHRDALFTNNPPRYIAVFRKRARTSKNAAFPKGEASATCHAWFIWYRGFKGNPEILRI